MAKKVGIKFPLDKNNYPLDFIMVLAMSGHLKLITPAELTYMFDSGRTIDQISNELLRRVVANRGNR